MAKGNKNGAGAGTVQVGGANPSQQMSIFPARPKRGPNEKPEGRIVRLITNLFQISFKGKNEVIHKHTVEISERSDEEAKRERKLPREVRQEIVNLALAQYIANNCPELKYHVIDREVFCVYSLFNIRSSHGDGPVEQLVDYRDDTIEKGKLIKVSKTFCVKFFKGAALRIEDLFKYCRKGATSHPDSNLYELMSAVNTILNHGIVVNTDYLSTRYNIFPFARGITERFSVSSGISGVKGFSISPKMTEQGIMMNAANTVAMFYDPIFLHEFVQQRYNFRDFTKGMPQGMIEVLKKELRNKQVEATHVNYGIKERPHYRKYRIDTIKDNSLSTFTLLDKDNGKSEEISRKDYFMKTYQVKLKYPMLPLIYDKQMRAIPMELCRLVDKQIVNRKATPEETQVIIKKSAVPAIDHFKAIENHLGKAKESILAPVKSFNMDLDFKNVECDGRVMRPLELMGGRGYVLKPDNGGYMPKLLAKPVKVDRFALVFITDRDVMNDFQNGRLKTDVFLSRYANAAREKGIQVMPNSGKVMPLDIGTDMKTAMRKLADCVRDLNKNKVQHAIFVLPRICPDAVYRFLQYLEADLGKGLTTPATRISCIRYDNYLNKIINSRDDGRMFLSNLWLKYNTKLGGVNVHLAPAKHRFLQDGYLFVSIDVCHPAPGDTLSQSVAAVVGMWDVASPNMGHHTRIVAQKKTENGSTTIEKVGQIGAMFREIVCAYGSRKKKPPTHLIILRDGVSEGQLEMVLNEELGQVKGDISKLMASKNCSMPKMSCVVVQKRHKTRFRLKEAGVDRRGNKDYNIPPGTVVDSDVVHPHDHTFYIAAHKAIQGTTRAAHMYVILDEIGFSQDEYQIMMHGLSYLSPRCTKGTSIPTPVNLADRAAERGKNIVVSWNEIHEVKGMPADEHLKKINAYLNSLGDSNYLNTLFYI